MNGNKRTVFVIGAGWVGAPLARKLHLSGHRVVATSRSAEKVRALMMAGTHAVRWDCEEHQPGADRSDSLQHMAGDTTHWVLTIPPLKGMNQAENEQWHRDVLHAAEKSQVKRLVILSSTSVYPEEGMVQESDASEDSISPHSGKSMRSLERVFESTQLDVVILRLGALIGPGRHPAMRASQKGWRSPHRRMNATTLEDVLRACDHVLFRKACLGLCNVVSPHHPTFNEFGERLVGMGWPPVLFQTSQEGALAVATGRAVSSEKLVQSGFVFQTNDLFEWASNAGGMKSGLYIPSELGPIHGTLHHATATGAKKQAQVKEMLVFAHGYKGFKNWGAWSLALDALCNQQRSAFRFDFTHNGVTSWFPDEIIDTERWSENTYRKEIDELKAVSTHWLNQGYRVSLIGHSRGGGIASIAASELQASGTPVDACLLWAAVSDFESRFPDETAMSAWQQSDRWEIINQRTGQTLHHRFGFYESFHREKGNLNIQDALSRLECPVFIAHAKDDLAVLPSEAESLCKVTQMDIQWLNQGGHTFGSRQPWLSSELPDDMLDLINGSRNFLDQRYM